MDSGISIVIPTYRNPDMILRCLEALARQSFPMERMEVNVIVDGSPDHTMEVLSTYASRAPFRLQYVWQENAGAGPARNRGMQISSHDLILILNDDVLVGPHVVSRHVAWHEANPEKEYALLGNFEEAQPPSQMAGYFITRLENEFERLHGRHELEWHHFWTGNISFKKQFIVQTDEWFTNAFPHPAHEDVELGYRLHRCGMRLYHDPQALGVHEHFMTYEQYVRRAYQTGICLVVFYRLHPELKEWLVARGMISPALPGFNPLRFWLAAGVLNGLTVWFFESLAKVFNRTGCRRQARFLFSRLFGYYQRKGVQAGVARFFLETEPLR